MKPDCRETHKAAETFGISIKKIIQRFIKAKVIGSGFIKIGKILRYALSSLSVKYTNA